MKKRELDLLIMTNFQFDPQMLTIGITHVFCDKLCLDNKSSKFVADGTTNRSIEQFGQTTFFPFHLRRFRERSDETYQ